MQLFALLKLDTKMLLSQVLNQTALRIFLHADLGWWHFWVLLLWNSQNREHQKYLWNAIVLREKSQ